MLGRAGWITLLVLAITLLTLGEAWAEPIMPTDPQLELEVVTFTEQSKSKPFFYGVLYAFLKRTGLKFAITSYPFPRAANAIEERVVCLGFASLNFATIRDLTWVGPLFEVRYAVFARPGVSPKIARLEDLSGKTVGVVAGGLGERMLRAANAKPETVTRDELNLAKLDAGRLDYWFTAQEYAKLYVRHAHDATPEMILQLEPSQGGFVCHPQTPERIIKVLKAKMPDFYAEFAHTWPILEDMVETGAR